MKKIKKNNKPYLIIGIILTFLLVLFIIKLVSNDKPKKSYFTPSNNITIRYAYGISVSTIEQKNKQEPYLDIVNIKVQGKELEELKKVIKKNGFILDRTIDSVGVGGAYELTIGDEVVFFDQEEGIYTKDKKVFYKIDISTELFDKVSDIVFNHVNPTQEKIKTTAIYIKNPEYGETIFTDKEDIDNIINSFRYVKLKSKSDILYDPSNYIDFGNGIIITMYQNSDIANYRNNTTGEDVNILLYSNPSEALRNYLVEKVTEDEGKLSSIQ